MGKKVRFGIIGFGSIAGHHLKAINALDNAEVVAVSARNPEKIKSNPALEGIAIYATEDQLIEDPAVDAVSICTPSGMHLEPAQKAAAAGKHILVEKPLEISQERSLQLIQAAQQAGVKLACIFQNRYAEDYSKLKQAVKQNELGKLVLGNAYIKWFRDASYYHSSDWKGVLDADGGAALINQSIHTIDLLLDVMGPVRSVRAKVTTRTHAIEGEDLGVAILEFASGALGTVEGSTAIYAGFPERLEVHGQNGSMILEKGRLVHDLNGPIEVADDVSSGAADPMAIDFQLHQRQIGEFVGNILEGTEPTVNGPESIKAVQLINAIYQASREDRVVYLD